MNSKKQKLSSALLSATVLLMRYDQQLIVANESAHCLYDSSLLLLSELRGGENVDIFRRTLKTTLQPGFNEAFYVFSCVFSFLVCLLLIFLNTNTYLRLKLLRFHIFMLLVLIIFPSTAVIIINTVLLVLGCMNVEGTHSVCLATQYAPSYNADFLGLNITNKGRHLSIYSKHPSKNNMLHFNIFPQIQLKQSKRKRKKQHIIQPFHTLHTKTIIFSSFQ